MNKPRKHDPSSAKRRRYESPRVVGEVDFETRALSCVGNNGTDCPGPFLAS